MLKLATPFWCLLGAARTIVTLSACSDSSNRRSQPPEPEPEYLPIADPEVSLPPDEGSINLLAQTFDLGDVGYEQAEFFLEGNATAFTNVNELLADGQWGR